jgi:N,N'-diacetyllegionaminate synthase
MRIGNVDLNERVLVIAEIGNNHEGDADSAAALVRAAAAAGADAVKLQTFRTEQFISRETPERFDQLERFRLADEVVVGLHAIAQESGLLFLSTPLDLDSARFLEPLVDAYKIASSDNTFFPLLETVAATGKPVVVSAGLSDLDKIRSGVRFVQEQWESRDTEQELLVLHCVTAYPAEPEDVNLAAIGYLADELECSVGYSDHTLGIETCELAVAAGARAIEKHFTLDKERSTFRDHQLSADPEDFRRLVERVRHIEQILGTRGKRVQPSEEALAPAVARSTVAGADLPLGHVVGAEDLMWTRPGGGLAPGEEHVLLGRILRRDVTLGERILPQDVD